MIPAAARWANAIVLVAALGLGCAFAPTQPVDRAGANRDYAEALRLASDRPEAGVVALEGFLRNHPRSSLADDAALRLAELQVASGARVAATRTLERTLRQHPAGDKSDASRLLLAQLLGDRGLPRQAYRHASRIRLTRLDPPARRGALRLLVDLSRANGETVDQLRWLARAQADAADERSRSSAAAEMNSALAALDAAALERVAEQLGSRVPAARVRLRQAELAIARGDEDLARRTIALARRLPLGPSDAEYLASVEAQLAGGEAQRLLRYSALAPVAQPGGGRARGTLGVVLPLSGRYASYGEATLKGILLATGHFDARDQRPSNGAAARPPSGIRLLIRDTGGDPARAAAATRELAARAEVSAVLGPMLAGGK